MCHLFISILYLLAKGAPGLLDPKLVVQLVPVLVQAA